MNEIEEKKLSIYVRRFSTKKVVKEETQIFAYFPKPMRQALLISSRSQGGIEMSDYILGPLYKKNFQIGVSGKIAKREAADKGCARELGEELGLVPKHLYDLQSIGKGQMGREGKKKVIFTYTLKISRASPVLDHQEGVHITDNVDTENQKIGCLVFGTKEELLKYLKRPNIFLYASSDDVIGVGMIKVADIFSLIKEEKLR